MTSGVDPDITFGVFEKRNNEFYIYVKTHATAEQAISNNWHINWIGKEMEDGTNFFRQSEHAAGTSMAWSDGSQGSDGIVALQLSSTAVSDWYRTYQNFVIVTTLSGRDKVRGILTMSLPRQFRCTRMLSRTHTFAAGRRVDRMVVTDCQLRWIVRGASSADYSVGLGIATCYRGNYGRVARRLDRSAGLAS
eukprot:SAG31_NODE_2879_length_4960_cov_13.684839_3_plen_192_part_00